MIQVIRCAGLSASVRLLVRTTGWANWGVRAITMSQNCSFGKSQLKSHQLWQNAVTQRTFARITPNFFLPQIQFANVNNHTEFQYEFNNLGLGISCHGGCLRYPRLQVLLCDKCWLLRWTKKPVMLRGTVHARTRTKTSLTVTYCKLQLNLQSLSSNNNEHKVKVHNMTVQEAQLMLTTCLAVSRDQQTWYHFGSVATFR